MLKSQPNAEWRIDRNLLTATVIPSSGYVSITSGHVDVAAKMESANCHQLQSSRKIRRFTRQMTTAVRTGGCCYFHWPIHLSGYVYRSTFGLNVIGP